MIQLGLIRRITGAMVMAFGLTMLPPLVVSFLYRDGKWGVFFALMLLALGVGFLFFRNTKMDHEPKNRDGFLIVVLIWFGFTLVGALPFVWGLGLSYTDAVFEAASGLTTTGATVLSGLDNMAKSMLWYRIQLHFLGGMGVIILAVAILPLLNIGGMRLYKTEATGPMKDDKLAPRIAQTARLLSGVYLALIVSFAFVFWTLGMTAFDAICHGISAISTGGFGNYDANLGYYASPAIHVVTILGMIAGGVNMGLHFAVWHHKSPEMYVKDQESRWFLTMLLLASLLIAITLFLNHSFSSFWLALLNAIFATTSIFTSTGFAIADHSVWPSFVPFLLMMLAYVGACAGSTAGGIKTLRIYLLFKQASREAKRLVQPNIVAHVKFNGRVIPDNVSDGVWGFFALWVLTSAIFTLALMATGLSPIGAFGAATAAINNMGVGLNETAASFANVSTVGKWLLSLCMLVGRLEIFTVFVLLTPIFWRRF